MNPTASRAPHAEVCAKAADTRDDTDGAPRPCPKLLVSRCSLGRLHRKPPVDMPFSQDCSAAHCAEKSLQVRFGSELKLSIPSLVQLASERCLLRFLRRWRSLARVHLKEQKDTNEDTNKDANEDTNKDTSNKQRRKRRHKQRYKQRKQQQSEALPKPDCVRAKDKRLRSAK